MSRRASSTRGSAPSTAKAGNASPSKWIVSPRYDQFFLFGAWGVPLALYALALALPGNLGLLIALAVFVLLDNSHQVATLPLTVFDPGTMRSHAPAYLGGAAAIGAAAVAQSFFPDSLASKLWTSLVLYWGAWHLIRQHYGFLRLYQHRDKPSNPRVAQAESLALYAGAVFPYFVSLSHESWADDPLGKLLYRLPVPPWSAWIVFAVFASAFVVMLADAASRVRRGEALFTPRFVHVLLVVSNFWMGLLWAGASNLLVAVLFITSYHDLQYHAVLWFVGKKRVAPADAPVYPLVRRMFSSMGVFVFAIVAGAVLQALLRNDFQLMSHVLPASAATTALFALVNSYAYMHYWFDGNMWKLSSDARLRAELGLGGGAAS